jgi:predicted RNA polymerase sigma factor
MGGERALDDLELDGYWYVHSTRADLLGRLGRSDDATRVRATSRRPSPSIASSRQG